MISITLLIAAYKLVKQGSGDIDDFIHPGLIIGLIITGTFDATIILVTIMTLFTK